MSPSRARVSTWAEEGWSPKASHSSSVRDAAAGIGVGAGAGTGAGISFGAGAGAGAGGVASATGLARERNPAREHIPREVRADVSVVPSPSTLVT